MDEFDNLVEEYFHSGIVDSVFCKYEGFKSVLLQDWKSLARIYAPSEHERERAEYLVKKFREYGISNSYLDETGNAVGVLEMGDGPTIAFLCTMDDLLTVAEYVKTWGKPLEEKNGRLIGPGTNSSATCATLLGVAKLFSQQEVDFNGKLYFVGGVCEELGLQGVRGFLKDHEDEIDYFIEVSGGIGRISYGAIGIHWLKVHYKGPRAHTLRGRGPNVTKGVAKSVDRIFSIPLPPESYLNIAMLGAGKVYNHRSDDGWHSVDVRSTDNHVLLGLRERILKIVEEVAEEEELEWWIEDFSIQEAGQIEGAKESNLVRIAEESTKLLGREPMLSNRGSSNLNAAINKGILTVALGGERGAERDTPNEYANIQPVLDGVKLHFLVGYILGKTHANHPK